MSTLPNLPITESEIKYYHLRQLHTALTNLPASVDKLYRFGPNPNPIPEKVYLFSQARDIFNEKVKISTEISFVFPPDVDKEEYLLRLLQKMCNPLERIAVDLTGKNFYLTGAAMVALYHKVIMVPDIVSSAKHFWEFLNTLPDVNLNFDVKWNLYSEYDDLLTQLKSQGYTLSIQGNGTFLPINTPSWVKNWFPEITGIEPVKLSDYPGHPGYYIDKFSFILKFLPDKRLVAVATYNPVTKVASRLTPEDRSVAFDLKIDVMEDETLFETNLGLKSSALTPPAPAPAPTPAPAPAPAPPLESPSTSPFLSRTKPQKVEEKKFTLEVLIGKKDFPLLVGMENLEISINQFLVSENTYSIHLMGPLMMLVEMATNLPSTCTWKIY